MLFVVDVVVSVVGIIVMACEFKTKEMGIENKQFNLVKVCKQKMQYEECSQSSDFSQYYILLVLKEYRITWQRWMVHATEFIFSFIWKKFWVLNLNTY